MEGRIPYESWLCAGSLFLCSFWPTLRSLFYAHFGWFLHFGWIVHFGGNAHFGMFLHFGYDAHFGLFRTFCERYCAHFGNRFVHFGTKMNYGLGYVTHIPHMYCPCRHSFANSEGMCAPANRYELHIWRVGE